ncbi:MAG: hypothetical protein ACI8Y4_004757, partial [Candidatus Poriferisodalaceae bacterium]
MMRWASYGDVVYGEPGAFEAFIDGGDGRVTSATVTSTRMAGPDDMKTTATKAGADALFETHNDAYWARAQASLAFHAIEPSLRLREEGVLRCAIFVPFGCDVAQPQNGTSPEPRFRAGGTF